ncbi:MAG: ArsI/CadI family heavy metal resistance metalloenzyme [Gammaproteobacteria bacterium]
MVRLQLALNVPDLDAAVAYYSKLFDAEPHKRRDGYVNFALDEPALKLVLFENPAADAQLNHLGVEVMEADELESASRRLDAAGILDSVETSTECCHASQDKIWSRAHNGLRWEWYRILEDDTDPQRDRLGCTCCTGGRMADNIGA